MTPQTPQTPDPQTPFRGLLGEALVGEVLVVGWFPLFLVLLRLLLPLPLHISSHS